MLTFHQKPRKCLGFVNTREGFACSSRSIRDPEFIAATLSSQQQKIVGSSQFYMLSGPAQFWLFRIVRGQ
jgi:hypothetical protein